MDTSVSTPNLAATALALLLLADLLPTYPIDNGSVFRHNHQSVSAAAPCRHRRHRP
ncbi:hypothetical protein [Hymenobacter swuensis]|uniref:Uncharacterized protein n=1 Tax=Hymenobacter swuensis DY53 TaxID=1227739 RepID=W8EZM4_9BACT|nr:hypothetical protein [Hymenobacter swuensis]AHJ97212.1 hypothetical protein Hsw_1617 [Hymenobacter swuensis DY53]